MKVLLIEDDAATQEEVARLLTNAGNEVVVEGLGLVAMVRFFGSDFDIVISDLTLPDTPLGFLFKFFSEIQGSCGLIMLADVHDMDIKVAALRAGADDFITKPYHGDELLARISAVARRTLSPFRVSITLHDLSLNLTNHSGTVCGKSVRLTTKEFDLLWYLASHHDVVCGKDVIARHLYGSSTSQHYESVICVHKFRVRKSLAMHGLSEVIISTRRGGYMLLKEACKVAQPL